MNLFTKEECEKALNSLYKVADKLVLNHNIFIGSYDILKNLIEEHFSNPPLKFEELQERETYYHIYYGWISIRSISDCECILINTLNSDGYKQIEFEENRFYRKQVEE